MKSVKTLFCAAMLCVAAAASAKTENITIQGSVGQLSALLTIPDGLAEGAKCPVAILMHGFMGNKDGILEKLTAEKLASLGVASVRFDFNGHIRRVE